MHSSRAEGRGAYTLTPTLGQGVGINSLFLHGLSMNMNIRMDERLKLPSPCKHSHAGVDITPIPLISVPR